MFAKNSTESASKFRRQPCPQTAHQSPLSLTLCLHGHFHITIRLKDSVLGYDEDDGDDDDDDDSVSGQMFINLLATDFFFQILAHPVFKM